MECKQPRTNGSDSQCLHGWFILIKSYDVMFDLNRIMSFSFTFYEWSNKEGYLNRLGAASNISLCHIRITWVTFIPRPSFYPFYDVPLKILACVLYPYSKWMNMRHLFSEKREREREREREHNSKQTIFYPVFIQIFIKSLDNQLKIRSMYNVHLKTIKHLQLVEPYMYIATLPCVNFVQCNKPTFKLPLVIPHSHTLSTQTFLI